MPEDQGDQRRIDRLLNYIPRDGEQERDDREAVERAIKAFEAMREALGQVTDAYEAFYGREIHDAVSHGMAEQGEADMLDKARAALALASQVDIIRQKPDASCHCGHPDCGAC